MRLGQGTLTMDEGLSVAVRKIFVDLYKRISSTEANILSTGVRDATPHFQTRS